jgi:phosphoglycolate phosphatase-like HAD superfamily hydrolase
MLTLLLLSLGLSLPAAEQGVAVNVLAVGDTVDYDFEATPLNALGVSGFDDLRGKPVLVAFWNSSTWADDWVADAVVWQKQFGEDLAVIFSEIPTMGVDSMEAVALRKKWLGSRALWTVEYPAFTGKVGTPQYTLIDGSGTIVAADVTSMNGMSFDSRGMDAIEDLIAEHVRQRREGPDDAPTEVRASFKRFARGDWRDALAEARAVADSDEASAAVEEFLHRLDQKLKRAEALLAEGRLLELKDELEPFDGELVDESDLLARYLALVAALESETLETELEAAHELTKLEKKLFDKGPKSATVRSLSKLAKKYAGTRSAARAERYVFLAEVR